MTLFGWVVIGWPVLGILGMLIYVKLCFNKIYLSTLFTLIFVGIIMGPIAFVVPVLILLFKGLSRIPDPVVWTFK